MALRKLLEAKDYAVRARAMERLEQLSSAVLDIQQQMRRDSVRPVNALYPGIILSDPNSLERLWSLFGAEHC